LTGVEALVVPVPLTAAAVAPTRLYTVRRGDTLVTIADRFGVSLSQLRRWNGIPSGIRVDPGRRLHVAEPVLVSTASTHRRKTAGQAGPSTSRPGAASSQIKPGGRPGSVTPKPAHPQATKPVAHTSTSTTHKPTSTQKSSRQ
jgi:membrane-bound lytic murein transglycosylase D